MRRYLFLLTAVLTTALLAACATPPPAAPPALQARGIVVLKSLRRMYLINESGLAYREYPIALGANPIGHKQQEGDERTPEGLYTIETRNPHSDYHLSLKISYPNAADKEAARVRGVSPGGDIFIHGLPNDSWFLTVGRYRNDPNWTNGCIAVANRDMRELWSLVNDGTPIEIRP